MLYETNSSLGTISVDRAVLCGVIRREAERFQGKVLLSNHKGKVNSARKGGGQFAEFSWGARGLDIRIFIVVRFGTSIGGVADAMIDGVKKSVEAFSGIEINSVAVVISGVLSKNLSKRSIEVKKE
jgi:uncharacterized alkaline shock family protein YloU